mgnify:CR=1
GFEPTWVIGIFLPPNSEYKLTAFQLFVTTNRKFYIFELQFLLMTGGDLTVAIEFPNRRVSKIFVISRRFSILRLILLPEVSPAGFFSFESI